MSEPTRKNQDETSPYQEPESESYFDRTEDELNKIREQIKQAYSSLDSNEDKDEFLAEDAPAQNSSTLRPPSSKTEPDHNAIKENVIQRVKRQESVEERE